MVGLGIAITALTGAVLLVEFLRHRRTTLPLYGWLGLIALVMAEVLMLWGIQPVATYFTPVAWTAYILLVDSAVLAISGRSRLRNEPRQLLKVALLSIPLWLIFEAYNLRLGNWTYVGVPVSWAGALLGYGWSFATITPGIFETADFVESFGWFKPAPPVKFSPALRRSMIFGGAICLAVPLLVPRHVAAYLFVLVWIGFIFFLDPINYSRGLPSLLDDLASGRRSRFYSLLLAGWVCGWLWEFWNYWATAKWHYIFPMFREWKVFEMPAPGYLGFLPFALESFVMYVAASHFLKKAATVRREQETAS